MSPTLVTIPKIGSTSSEITQLNPGATMRTFDITPDGKQIIFDRLSENSDIVLIELGQPQQSATHGPYKSQNLKFFIYLSLNKVREGRSMAETDTIATNLVIRLEGDLKGPVIPGTVFARLVPSEVPTEPDESDDEDGEEKESTAREVKLSVEEGCELVEGDQAVRATVFGLAEVRGGCANVQPLLKVSPDNMKVLATVYGTDSLGNPITSEVISRAMDPLEVKEEPDLEAIQSAIDGAGTDGKPLRDVVIAAGKEPKNGRDERVELEVDTAQTVGTIKEDGSINFYEKGAVCSVTEGQLLGRLIPLEKGVPGHDLFGNELPAEDGKPSDFKAGENVSTSDDGLEFRSQIDGMVKYVHNTLSISELFEIPSDVDFNTGNIHMERGSVSIQGTVRSGFVVTSSGNVVVTEAIEDAQIDADGDVMVQNGILMQGNGFVKAEGGVIAQFAQNARIEACGDVVINNIITSCDIAAEGKVLATQGNGRIQGGVIRSQEGIEVNVVGSPSNTPTRLVVGSEQKDQRDLAGRKKDLEAKIRRITREIGSGDIREILQNTPPHKLATVKRNLEMLSEAHNRLVETKKELEEQERKAKESFGKQIKIMHTLYPGVTITMAGCTLKIDHRISGCTLYYDRTDDTIKPR